MGRLVAVSLSPAVDRTYQVPGLRTGALHRVDPPVVSAGGKGVNVARVLSCLGESPLLAGFFAGGTGAFVRRALEQCGVEVLAEEVEGETRTNLNLIDPDAGQETEILEPGPVVDREALQRLSKALVDRVGPGDTVILSGSMMFEHLGWTEVSNAIVRSMMRTFSNKTVTYDFERLMTGATLLKCSEFGKAIIDNL